MNYCTFESRGIENDDCAVPLHSDCRSGALMPKKRKPKPFRAVTAVKELARERVGQPPTEKIVVEKKRKPERHKVNLAKLLDEAD